MKATRFITEDGKEFENERDALMHESHVRHEKHEREINAKIERIRFRIRQNIEEHNIDFEKGFKGDYFAWNKDVCAWCFFGDPLLEEKLRGIGWQIDVTKIH